MPVKDIAQKVSFDQPGRVQPHPSAGAGGYHRRLAQWCCAQPGAPPVEALISVFADATRASFLAMIEQESQVLQCFRVTGSYNFIIKVSCTDIDALEHLLTKMQKMVPPTPRSS